MAASDPLEHVLPPKPAARMTEVIELMEAIVAALPPTDGVSAFTRLYVAVTEGISGAAHGGRYEDVRFVRWLDVVFANLYFDALRPLALGEGRVPSAWAPLVEARGRSGILPLQFALAGMNAHINRDLPVALVRTCEAREVELRRSSPQYRDFLLIDKLLAQTEERVKPSFVTGVVADVDAVLGRLDDVVAIWNVERARQAAWVNAETLWALRGLPGLRAEFLRTLDRLVGFAGRGLLQPVIVE